MNIFEDLVGELKEANLIEETVIETGKAENPKAKEAQPTVAVRSSENANRASVEQKTLPSPKAVEQTEAAERRAVETNSSKVETKTPPVKPKKVEAVEAVAPVENISTETNDESFEAVAEETISEAEFYRRRATGEVAFLQTVEAAFAGIEREQLKIVPKIFDDLKVKKLLHLFLQNSDEAQSPEFVKAETELLRETQNWYASLAARDTRCLAAHLRRFYETTRPQLSASALAALARFYRNAPFSEAVRSKFDLTATRLFSKETDDNRRETLFTRDELTDHIKELYAEWSSVSLYPTEEKSSAVREITDTVDAFITEAQAAQHFDDLIGKNFFNRLRLFKENTNENFFAPAVVAAVVECNIRVGNRYIELLDREKAVGNVANLETKYGLSHDQAISEATGKTLSLLELLNQRKEVLKSVEKKPVVVAPEIKEDAPKSSAAEKSVEPTKSKKWMLSVAVLAIIALIAFYLGTKSDVGKTVEPSSIPKLNLENSMMKDFLSEAVVEDATLKGTVTPSWNHYTSEKKKDVLRQTASFGADKGFNKVQLSDKNGKLVGSDSDGMVFVND